MQKVYIYLNNDFFRNFFINILIFYTFNKKIVKKVKSLRGVALRDTNKGTYI